MDRGVAILFILLQTLLMPANMGTIFGFPNSKKRFKVNANRRAMRLIPTRNTVEPQRVWENLNLRDRNGKTKMPEYLRTGIQMPRSIFNIYPPTDAYESTPSTQNKDQMTENHNSENKQSSNMSLSSMYVEDRVYESRETEQQTEVVEAVTHYTILVPAEDKKDTCLWRVQPPQKPRKTDLAARVTMKKVQPDDPGSNVGAWIHNTWECIKKRFWVSFKKVKSKIYNMLEGFDDTETPIKAVATLEGSKKRNTTKTNTTKNETVANTTKTNTTKIETVANETKPDINKTKADAKRTKPDINKTKADAKRTKPDISTIEAHDHKIKTDKPKTEASDNKTKTDKLTTESGDNKTKTDKPTTEASDNKTKTDKLTTEAGDNKTKTDKPTTEGVETTTNSSTGHKSDRRYRKLDRPSLRQRKPRKSRRRFRLPFLH